MNTVFGLSSSLFSLLVVVMITATVAAAMWSAQIISDERRNRR
ncbi:hypothetical protein [Nocardioides yefusunii]|uniref:Uncharacterized protein n=1 Tax=Nocardioides yefusunii TaxID=2500546 RepID=A0ABW1QZR7_9ACTN|nr:hypothetical protein [Nocardioides yefusunii]